MKQKNKVVELNKIISEQQALINQLRIEKDMIANSRKYKLGCLLVKIFKPFKRPGLFFYSLFFRNKKKQRRKIDNVFPYFSKYENNIDFSNYKTDIKALAFYLPQFHEFKENNEWWGKGFTEWTNAKKSKPRFKGHYQPRLPHDDIGYYDLSTIGAMKKQIVLAKQHKIYGFVFYYYWFSGKRLMEKPVDLLLENKDIDFPFCLCWANENWTRRWDGQDNQILIKQNYSKDDAKKFIRDIKPYVIDKRYICVDNRPIILIYNPNAIPDVEKMINNWRIEAKRIGIGELYIITRKLLFSSDQTISNVDAEFDFPPITHGINDCKLFENKEMWAFDYKKTVDCMCDSIGAKVSNKPYYYTSTMGWDNSSRRKDSCFVFLNYNLRSFYKWNKAICSYLNNNFNKNNRFLFINAWNEWCEGTYLDPDKKYGYANINTLSKAVCGLPFVSIKTNTNNIEKKYKVAIQVHVFYVDLLDEIIAELKKIPISFDCFISTNIKEKAIVIKEKVFAIKNMNALHISIEKNVGRDVWPFISQLKNYYKNYDFICHIHTKKSSRAVYENEWRKFLYSKLFGSKSNIENIFNILSMNENIGVVCPSVFNKISSQVDDYNGNLENCKKLCKILGIDVRYLSLNLVFPAGTMFWAKTKAIYKLFDRIKIDDFEKECNQDNCTFAHAIERGISTIALSNGFDTYFIE